MRLWFIGEGVFASLCLGHLKRLFGGELERVYTGLPTVANRGRETPSPVEIKALELGFVSGKDFFRTGPLSKNEELMSEIKVNAPDAVFVVDFGQIIREPLLNAPRLGCVNIHPSLLPRWRGAAPIQRALMNGDTETGVTVFRLVPAMDAGPVIRSASIKTGLNVSASQLYVELSELGAKIAFEGLKASEKNGAKLTEQDDAAATAASKLSRKEFEIFWDMPAVKIHNTARALDMSGGAYATLSDGKRLKLWKTFPVEANGIAQMPGIVIKLDGDGPVISCGECALKLLEVQAEGKRRISAAEWARGSRIREGQSLLAADMRGEPPS